MKKSLIAVLLLLALALPGCGKISFPRASETPAEKPDPAAYAEGAELLALAKTEEEAQEIAELYGIELVSFSDGVATFHTEEDPRTVSARGQKEGWPLVEPNYIREPHSK